MAIIPNGQQILTSSPEVNTTYGGSASLKELNTWYTMEDIIETVNENVGSTYKVYTALVSQFGTGDPIVTILENTLGGTVVFSRNSAGSYLVTATDLLTINKTAINIGPLSPNSGAPFNNDPFVTVNSPFTNDSFTFNVRAISDGAGVDGCLSNTFFEIRVYN